MVFDNELITPAGAKKKFKMLMDMRVHYTLKPDGILCKTFEIAVEAATGMSVLEIDHNLPSAQI
jgi:hypothetical protein